MVTAKAPTRRHCETCGYPFQGQSCVVCGAAAKPLSYRDLTWESKPPNARDSGHADLDWAFEAWNKKEYSRFVTHCLAVVGVANARSVSLPKGQGFLAELQGQPVLISVEGDYVSFEAPIAELPRTRRLGLMRMALEMSHLDRHPARLALRGTWVIGRFTGLLVETDPEHFVWALRSLVEVARTVEEVAVVAFDAPPVVSDTAPFNWDAVPTRVTLSKLAPPAPESGPVAAASSRAASSGPGLFDSMPSLSEDGYPDEADDDDGATLVKEPEPLARPTPSRPDVATTAVSEPPPVAAERPKPAKPPLPKPTKPTGTSATMAAPVPRKPEASVPVEVKSTPKPEPAAPTTQAGVPSSAAASKAVPSAVPKTTPTGAPPAVKQTEAASRFCGMLGSAKKLSAELTYEEHPATLMLLLRSTVYRAVFEHSDAVPDAVAHLFHGTAGVLREIYITAPGRRRGAMQIPRPDSAHDVIDRIIESGASFGKEPPVKILPMTTARDAKDHLARYVAEIEQAPTDLALRHFLALGALCELLVRTKLPGPTQQKLRSIVTHSLREGAKPASVELMMTALKRIIG